MNMKVQDKIRTLRTSKGWTQENMAELLGLSPNGYSNIERGETELTMSRLEQIAKLFEMSALDLLSVGEKGGFNLTGTNNNNNNSQNNSPSCNFYTDQALAHENEKLKIQLTAKEKENQLLNERIRDLENLVALLGKK
jgi:transcriptional regulator with XRE-family HTH domain